MALWHLSLFILFSFLGADAAVFTLRNKCQVTIWPGILPGSGHPLPMNGRLQLQPNATADCGKENCTTADCGGVLQCAGVGDTPPAS